MRLTKEALNAIKTLVELGYSTSTSTVRLSDKLATARFIFDVEITSEDSKALSKVFSVAADRMHGQAQHQQKSTDKSFKQKQRAKNKLAKVKKHDSTR